MTVAGTADAVVATATVVLAALALSAAVGTLLVVREGRRRWRRWRALDRRSRRQRIVERGVAAVAASPMSQPGWWLAQRERHRLWRSVTAAERAVVAAVDGGAPVGDLPSLSRRLRLQAESVDGAVQAAGAALPGEARSRVTDVVVMADQVRRAATEALLATAADPTGHGLADAIAVEVAALRHGLAATSWPRPRS